MKRNVLPILIAALGLSVPAGCNPSIPGPDGPETSADSTPPAVEVQVGPDVPAAVPSEPEAHPDETTGSHSDSQDSQAQPEEPEASSTGPKEPEAKPSIRKAGNWYITLQMALPTGKPAWEWDEDSQAELRCVSAASGEEDAFREFIQVDFASPPGRTRVGTFGSIELGKIGKDLKDFKVLSKKTIEVNGHEAYKAVYTFTQGQAKRKAQAYFFLPKATGLVVKCVSAADDYDSFSKTFEETVATIAWK